MDPKSKKILELEEEIARLRGLLAGCKCEVLDSAVELVEVTVKKLPWWRKLFGVPKS
jgi:hypothetical protein